MIQSRAFDEDRRSGGGDLYGETWCGELIRYRAVTSRTKSFSDTVPCAIEHQPNEVEAFMSELPQQHLDEDGTMVPGSTVARSSHQSAEEHKPGVATSVSLNRTTLNRATRHRAAAEPDCWRYDAKFFNESGRYGSKLPARCSPIERRTRRCVARLRLWSV